LDKNAPLPALWEQVQKVDRDATYKVLAKRMEAKFFRTFSPNNLGQLIQGSAKSDSPDTKNQIRIVLGEWFSKSESAILPTAESAQSEVEGFRDRGDGVTLEQWKQRAIIAEERLKQIAGIATAPINPGRDSYRRPKVSSKSTAEEEALLDALEKPDAPGGASKS
jgi:hypothetical protein